MKKNLVYLIGFPGVGKLTIAKEICKMENCILQDNHKTVNLLFPFLDLKKGIPEDTWSDVLSIRHIIYEFIKRNFRKDASLVFTDCLRDEDELAHQVFNEVKEIADTLGLAFYPVFLDCDIEVIKERITSEERKTNFKLTDVEDSFFEWKSLISVDEKNEIRLDVSSLTASDAAKTIIQKIEALEV